MAQRSSRARRTKSTFAKRKGKQYPLAGFLGNHCKCRDCHSSRAPFLGAFN